MNRPEVFSQEVEGIKMESPSFDAELAVPIYKVTHFRTSREFEEWQRASRRNIISADIVPCQPAFTPESSYYLIVVVYLE